MTPHRVLLKAAISAAGLGAALAFPAVASAAPGDDADHGRGSVTSPRSSHGPSTPSPATHRARTASARAATAPTPRSVSVRPPGPIQAAVLAMQSYVYGYPLLEFEKFRSASTSLNTIQLRTDFASPDAVPIWRPNADTFYSRAVLDLSDGPVVLSFPDMGDRYFSFQLIDPYTNVVDYIGARATGAGPGSFAISWSGAPQPTVDGAQAVTVPYNSMVMLGRTLVGDAADQQQAIALMNQFTLTASGPSAAPPPATDPPTGVALLDAMSAAMEIHPPPAADAARLQALAQIGVGPGLRVADADLGPLATSAVDMAVRAAVVLFPLLSGLTQYQSALLNRGWAVTDPSIGDYGTDYRLRAGVALIGPWANIPDEAVYSAGLLDRYLLPLNGSQDYVMHFAPGEQPPAGAFWSVTVYDPSGQFVRNPLNRYSISSSRPNELVQRPDGSVDIVFAQQDPTDPGANWLPIPDGEFSAYLRVYVPGDAVLDGSWTPPPIERVVIRR